MNTHPQYAHISILYKSFTHGKTFNVSDSYDLLKINFDFEIVDRKNCHNFSSFINYQNKQLVFTYFLQLKSRITMRYYQGFKIFTHGKITFCQCIVEVPIQC